jgi:predicted flavoprotein YhiN
MDKRYIIQKLIQLHEFNTEDIINIIHIYKIKYSRNSNGIFINLSLLSEDIIDSIYDKIQEIIPSKLSNKTTTTIGNKQMTNTTLLDFIPKKDSFTVHSIDQYLLNLSHQKLHI